MLYFIKIILFLQIVIVLGVILNICLRYTFKWCPDMFLVKPKQYRVTYANLVSQPNQFKPLTLDDISKLKTTFGTQCKDINLEQT